LFFEFTNNFKRFERLNSIQFGITITILGVAYTFIIILLIIAICEILKKIFK